MLTWLSVWTKVQTISIWSGWCHCHPVVSYVVKTRMDYLLGNSISSLSWYRAVKHAFPLCEFVTYWAILMPYWIHITPRLSNCCFPCESGLSSYLLHLFRKKALGDIWHRFFIGWLPFLSPEQWIRFKELTLTSSLAWSLHCPPPSSCGEVLLPLYKHSSVDALIECTNMLKICVY